jgi:hypothetical protein
MHDTVDLQVHEAASEFAASQNCNPCRESFHLIPGAVNKGSSICRDGRESGLDANGAASGFGEISKVVEGESHRK